MDKKLQEFIDKEILFYPPKNEQILESEEINSGDYEEPKETLRYWVRDEDFSVEDYQEFVKKQRELITKRFDKFLRYQKNC